MKNKIRKLAVVFVFLAVIVGVLYRFLDSSMIYENVIIEAGFESISIERFLKLKVGNPKCIQNLESIPSDRIGTYPLEIKAIGKIFPVVLEVVDTIPPKADTIILTLTAGATVEAKDFVKNIQDATLVTCEYRNPPDFDTPGSRMVTIALRDEGNNVTTLNTELQVKPAPPVEVIGADLQTVEGMADIILQEIITNDMDKQQRAKAIYNYVVTHISYIATSQKEDWVAAAYESIQANTGDCFNYYALSRALLTRAGIENVPIENKNRRHFWNLVNLGEGWYHFDTTPRAGDGDYFFLVTDAHLKEYARNHENSHDWEESLYPATP